MGEPVFSADDRKLIEAAKAAHPDGWLTRDGRWAYVNEWRHPTVIPLAGPGSDDLAVSSAPPHIRWRNVGGQVLHIGGAPLGYVCGQRVSAPSADIDGGKWPLCPGCAR